MATDYNANLIAELYSTNDENEATCICDEMVEIGDAVFPRQIYQAYKRFRDSSYSHYFISDLTKFNTPDVADMLKEIAHSTCSDTDVAFLLDYLTKIGYFDEIIVCKVKRIFEKEIINCEIDEYGVEEYLNYLEKSGANKEWLENSLQRCFENDKLDLRTRKISLKKLLKLNPKKYIDFYYKNYASLKSIKAEIIFVKEISSWTGGVVPSLHQMILQNGSEMAKEILQMVQEKKKSEKLLKETHEQNEIKNEYLTSDVISDIAELREKINRISSADKRFEFRFFTPSEEIYQQGKPAKDKAALVGYCMVLRALFGGFVDEINNFEVSKERAIELIPDINELKGSINKFHVMLLEKKIDVDRSIFGLRNINRIVSKLAHPSEGTESQLSEILKTEQLFEYYKEGNWSALHREILLRYKSVLVKMIDAIKGG